MVQSSIARGVLIPLAMEKIALGCQYSRGRQWILTQH